MHKLPAVIFAGGKSSRMKTDKALLPFKDKTTLSEFQYHKLSQGFSRVYLSAKQNKFPFQCVVIKDCYTESSPLVGLLSVFDYLDDDAVFILSVDAPMVHMDIINTLIKAYYQNPDADAIIAQSPQGIQPLCGIYTRTIATMLQNHYAQGKHALSPLLREAHTYWVVFEEEKPFANLNTPNEYHAIFHQE